MSKNNSSRSKAKELWLSRTPLERKTFKLKKRGFIEEHQLLFGPFNKYDTPAGMRLKSHWVREGAHVPEWYGAPVEQAEVYVFVKNEKRAMGYFTSYYDYLAKLEELVNDENSPYEYYSEEI